MECVCCGSLACLFLHLFLEQISLTGGRYCFHCRYRIKTKKELCVSEKIGRLTHAKTLKTRIYCIPTR